jgi:hypothetical protein
LFIQLGTDNLGAVTCTVTVIAGGLRGNAVIGTSTVTVGLEPLLAVTVYAVGSARNKTVITLNVAAVTVIGAVTVRAITLGSILKISFAIESRH